MALTSRIAITLALPLCFSIAAPRAQAQSPTAFGIQLGGTVPVSGYASDKHAGYHLGLLLDIRSPAPLVGFRIEGAYHEMKYSGNSTRAEIWMAGGDVQLKVPVTKLVSPYVIGGVGIYNSHRSLLLNSQYTTDPGVSVGGGLRFALADAAAFVEVRYHRATGSDAPRFVPITVGLLF